MAGGLWQERILLAWEETLITSITTLETKDIILSHLNICLRSTNGNLVHTRPQALLHTQIRAVSLQLVVLVGYPAWGKWSCFYTNFYQWVSLECPWSQCHCVTDASAVTAPRRQQTHWQHSTWCDSPTSLCSSLRGGQRKKHPKHCSLHYMTMQGRKSPFFHLITSAQEIFLLTVFKRNCKLSSPSVAVSQ